ncbi:MAG TPA: hypothetical protein VFF73_16130, partial [Planctomycetota bacterium]|nr:hypothetical protein [Planctomycetota bacterium]
MNHPSIDELRAIASGETDAANHVARCERCRDLVELARREEAALRGAIPAEPPKGFLEGTLAALDKEAKAPSRRVRRAPGSRSRWP